MNAPVSIIQSMSNAEYHAHKAFSSSQLKALLRSPAHFYAETIAKEVKVEESTAMAMGTLVHTLLLEPELFDSEFVIGQKFDRRTKQGKEDAETFEKLHQGKTVITQDDYDTAQAMVNNLLKLSISQEMQKHHGKTENSFFFTDPAFALSLRVRPDWHIAPCEAYPNGLIVDVKTTDDARPQAFSKNCAKYAYDLSCAMYREGFQLCYGTAEKPDFIFLVAERNAPFNVKQYKASEQFLSVGESRYHMVKSILAECLLLDEWQGYNADLTEIDMPNYLAKTI